MAAVGAGSAKVPESTAKTSWAVAPDTSGKRCSSVSTARCASTPGMSKFSTVCPPRAWLTAKMPRARAIQVSTTRRRRRTVARPRRYRKRAIARRLCGSDCQFVKACQMNAGRLKSPCMTPGLRERRKLQTREDIVNAALDLIEQKGYEATTVEDIASAADVSPRTFFRYFDSKLDVVLASKHHEDVDLGEVLATRPAHESPIE